MLVLALLLASCDTAAQAALARARAHADAFDLPRALELVLAVPGCDEAAGAAEYLEGVLGAAEAVKQGGTIDSLRDVRSAVNSLSRRAEAGSRRWEAASLALRAVAAASQYERGEMALYLAEATRIEGLLLAAGLPPAPFVTVHELAGDLWLQVHDFGEARVAYARAAEAVGRTGRVRLGLARASARLEDVQRACVEYRALAEWWAGRRAEGTPAEIAEARRYLASHACEAAP